MAKREAIREMMNDNARDFESSRERGNLPRGSGRTVWFTDAQLETVKRAVDAVRKIEGDTAIPEGRAIELACADFLAGVGDYEE